MWNICTRADNPTILVPVGEPVPPGYTAEAQTANPDYLTDSVEAVGGRRITVLAFRNRFTTQEKVGIEFAATDNPADTFENRMLAAHIRSYLKDVEAATYIDLDRDDTRGGVELMEYMGLLDAPGRALTILDAPITDVERPQ